MNRVVRGYSVQSSMPTWIMLVGILALIPFYKKHRHLPSVSSFLIIYMSLVGIEQGKHHEKGAGLYKKGQYINAISEYRKEIDTWHLRLSYNYHESSSMLGIATCYAQLEDFDKTLVTYKRMTEIFTDYYQERAKEDLVELEKSLKEIANYKKQLAVENDGNTKADMLFDLALLYRSMPCLKKARACYTLIQGLDIPESRKEQAREFLKKT